MNKNCDPKQFTLHPRMHTLKYSTAKGCKRQKEAASSKVPVKYFKDWCKLRGLGINKVSLFNYCAKILHLLFLIIIIWYTEVSQSLTRTEHLIALASGSTDFHGSITFFRYQ